MNMNLNWNMNVVIYFIVYAELLFFSERLLPYVKDYTWYRLISRLVSRRDFVLVL